MTSSYSAIYAFGDSLSDAGNVSIATAAIGAEPVSPPYYHQNYGVLSGAVFSNGPVWVQDLSTALGLGTLAPSLAGGNDFAYGGAETGSTPQNSGSLTTLALSLGAQLSQFATAVGTASPSALFTLSIGGNDIFDILSNTKLSAAQQATDVTDAVNNEIAAIHTMAKDGMKDLVVFNVPNLGLVPQVTFGDANGSDKPSASADALATSLSQSYNSQLAAALATQATSDGFGYQVVDVYSLITSAVANPAAFGYTNVTTPTWTGSFTDASSGTLTSTSVAQQNQDLFWDYIHPTASGHNNIADLALTEVAPSYVYEEDLNTAVYSFHAASAYLGQDTNLHTQFASVTADNVALFSSTSGTFMQSGAGNDILVAQSGINVVSAGGGSNYLVSGSGTDTFYVDATGAASTWNAVQNFHAGDILSVYGYDPANSKTIWTDGYNNAGATLNIDLKGDGSVWASDTFVGVSVADAAKYGTAVSGSGSVQTYSVIGV